MSLPQRHVIRRGPSAPAPTAARVSRPLPPPTLAPEDFADLEGDFDDDRTDPNLSIGAWAAHAGDEAPTARPVQVERPAALRAPRRHATGTPVPASTEAPTRAARRTPYPPELAPRNGSVVVPAPRRTVGDSGPRPLPPPPRVERPVAVARPEPSRVTPAPRSASVATPRPAPAPTPVAAPRPAPVAAPAPAPVAAPIAPAAAPQFDLPPELATPVYGLIRRLALQTELAAADRVLRVGLAELTDATVAMSRFVGDDGQPFSLEDQGDGGPSDAILATIAAAGCQVCDGHVLVQPIVAAGRTVALIVLMRNERLPGFAVVERAIALLVARECGGLMHQLLAAYDDRQREAAADARSLFRPEALESHRSRGSEGALMNLSPMWVRRAYPVAVALVVIALAFAVFAKVPTYSTGPVVITVDGTDVTAPAQGTVEKIMISAGDRVAAGDELARLYSVQEHAELEQTEQEYDNALMTFLVDNDDSAKQALAAASAKRERSRAVVEARTVRAPADGVVSDVRVKTGQNLMPGDRILTVVPEGADPVVVALLPGQDRPRLRAGMTLQVELKGFIKPRERVTITEVGSEVLGPEDARRTLGAQFADLVGQSGAWVLVKARLPRRTFAAQRHTYHFHNGLRGTGEVKVESKPFLVTLLPAVEKILF